MKRRMFIKKAAASAVGTVVIPTIVPASVFGKNAPSNRIHIGQIGFGRIARDHDMAETIVYDQAQFIAVCDVDKNGSMTGRTTSIITMRRRRATATIPMPSCMMITGRCF